MSTTNSGDDILVNKTDIYHQPLKWPSEEDLSGAAIALTRLQETYNIDPTDLAHGNYIHSNLDIVNKFVRPFLFTISNNSLYLM